MARGVSAALPSAFFILMLAACGAPEPLHEPGERNGSLAPCPAVDNCVHTGMRHPEGTRGIFLSGTLAAADLMPGVRAVVAAISGTTIVSEADPRYLHAEIRRGLFGTVDDLELFISPDRELIVRSGTRSRRTDGGANAGHVAELRERLDDAGLLR